MRILHLVVAGDLGGAERFLVDLVRCSAETGADHAIALFSPNPRLRDLFSAFHVYDAGRVAEHAGSFLRRTLGRSSTTFVARAALDYRATCLHMHTLGSHVLGVRAATRLARLTTVRTEHHIVHYTDWSARAFTDWAAQRTTRIVCVSDYVERWVATRRPALRPKLSTVRNGVDEQRFLALGPRTDDTYLRLAVACRLVGWKRVDWLLRALAELPAHVVLKIIGDGPERTSLERLTAKLGLRARVVFVGHVTDVAAAYASADFVVSASAREPLGLSILEGLACARPVVAFATGGVPEIVQDGVSGMLAPAESVPSLLTALRRAAATSGMQRAAMGAAAREFVERDGSARAMARGYGKVYAGLPHQRS
jgi:L-malate glycosyltransferase